MSNHIPVMLKEVIHYLNIQKNGIYVDCTFGGGGHSKEILKRLENGKLIAFDYDENVNSDSSKILLVNDNFVNLEKNLKNLNISFVNGFLFDLGLSSLQLDNEEYGLSYRHDSPLNMRLDKDAEVSASNIINNYSFEEMADIFYYYGEEIKARKIARKICEKRKKEKISSTKQLANIIISCFNYKKKKHPAKKIFQALRIAVNKELDNLEKGLKISLKHLSPKGRIVVISYHSLEDRIIKKIFKENNKNSFLIINKKPLVPCPKEIAVNHRARSAKMRIIARD